MPLIFARTPRNFIAPRWRGVFVIAAVLLASAAVAQSPAAPAEEPSTGPITYLITDAIIARVNGEALLLSRLKEAAFNQSIPLASLMADGIRSDGYRRAITLLVDETLLAQKAVEDGIEIDEMIISRNVEEMIKSLKLKLGSDEALERFLADRHLRLGELRRIFTRRERRAMLITQLVSRKVRTDAQRLEEFLAERKADGKSIEKVDLAQILVSAKPEDRETDKGRERYMRAIFVARQAGRAPDNFAGLATEYSDEPMAKETGGLIGWVDPARLRPALTKGLETMRPGDISDPIQTDLGYHILRLNDRRTARDLLFAEEFQLQRDRLIGQLRVEASIQLFDLEGKPLGHLESE